MKEETLADLFREKINREKEVKESIEALDLSKDMQEKLFNEYLSMNCVHVKINKDGKIIPAFLTSDFICEKCGKKVGSGYEKKSKRLKLKIERINKIIQKSTNSLSYWGMHNF